jgi:hypothetical protein
MVFMFSLPVIHSYDPCAFENYPGVTPVSEPYGADEYRKTLEERIAYEKGLKRLTVNHYRVYKVISYPLPIVDYTALEFRGGAYAEYIYGVWLSWRLWERWDTLHAAVEVFNDRDALALLTQETRALAGWSRYNDSTVFAHGLPFGHYALLFARFLKCRQCSAEDRAVIETGTYDLYTVQIPIQRPSSEHDS